MQGGRLLLWLLICCILWCSTAVQPSQASLQHVTVLFRHGDRSPIHIFPTSAHNQSAWPMGLGQLTYLGMQQQFHFGSFMRQRYATLLSEKYHLEELYVRSTDIDRALMSAQTHLAGLYYPNSTEDRWNVSIPWVPIPVHTMPQDEDVALLNPHCPQVAHLVDKTFQHSVEVQKLEVENRDFFAFLSNQTGIPNVTLRSISAIHDTLICEERHQLSRPSWLTQEYRDKLYYLNNLIWKYEYYNPEVRRLSAGVLLQTMVDNFLNVMHNSSVRMTIFSGHDTDVVALLSLLDLFNNIHPPYASAVILELHKESNWFVRLYFHNSSVESGEHPLPAPWQLTLPGCAPDCAWEHFLHLTASMRMTLAQHTMECEHHMMAFPASLYVIIFISLSLVVCLLVLVIAFYSSTN